MLLFDLVAGLPPRSRGPSPDLCMCGLWRTDDVVLGQSFLRVVRVFPVIVIPKMIHTPLHLQNYPKLKDKHAKLGDYPKIMVTFRTAGSDKKGPGVVLLFSEG